MCVCVCTNDAKQLDMQSNLSMRTHYMVAAATHEPTCATSHSRNSVCAQLDPQISGTVATVIYIDASHRALTARMRCSTCRVACSTLGLDNASHTDMYGHLSLRRLAAVVYSVKVTIDRMVPNTVPVAFSHKSSSPAAMSLELTRTGTRTGTSFTS